MRGLRTDNVPVGDVLAYGIRILSENRMKPLLARSMICITLLATASAWANETQSLTAKIDGAAFAADDNTILLVPLKGTFTLQAATAGAAAERS